MSLQMRQRDTQDRSTLGLWVLLLAVPACLIQALFFSAHASSRIKDLVAFEGIRENQLVGYGLVVGLGGTGGVSKDNPREQKAAYTP